MAYIVEMWHGRPHEIIVDDVNESGESITYTIPNGPPDPERRTFSCHGDGWYAAVAVGQAFGWKPKGPLLHSGFLNDRKTVRDSHYTPDGWIRGIHEVEPDDAQAWACALATCISAVEEGRFELLPLRSATLLREGMTLDEYRQANRGLTVQFLRSFAAFMKRGGFQFGWDS